MKSEAISGLENIKELLCELQILQQKSSNKNSPLATRSFQLYLKDIQEILDYMSLIIKYLEFDNEALRRERNMAEKEIARLKKKLRRPNGQ